MLTAEEIRDRRARRRIAYLEALGRLLTAICPLARMLLLSVALGNWAPHLLARLASS